MATETATPEPSLLQAAPSLARTKIEQLRTAAMEWVSSWIMLVFAGLVLSIVQLPYPVTIALLFLAYQAQQERQRKTWMHEVEERIAWGMRRGNWE